MKNCGGKISLQFKKIKAQIQSPDILKFVVRSTPLGLFYVAIVPWVSPTAIQIQPLRGYAAIAIKLAIV